MAAISEEQWKTALTEILAKLNDKEYDKMWEFVSKIPKQKKTKKLKIEMPQKIIKQYGVNESIQRIKNAMNKIRKDPGVQDLLRPFVDQLKSIAEAKKKGEFTPSHIAKLVWSSSGPHNVLTHGPNKE